MADLDPIKIMTEHAESTELDGKGQCRSMTHNGRCHWPCLPYQLAKTLAEANEREQRVRVVWDQYRDTEDGTMPWRLVRDMDAALGNPYEVSI